LLLLLLLLVFRLRSETSIDGDSGILSGQQHRRPQRAAVVM